MADHHRHVRQIGELARDVVQSRFATGHESRPQKKILGSVSAQGKFGRQQQMRALCVGLPCGCDDFLRVAREVAHDKIKLGNAECERHE